MIRAFPDRRSLRHPWLRPDGSIAAKKRRRRALKGAPRPCLFAGALLVVLISVAALPAHPAAGDEWTPISRERARLSYDVPGLSDAVVLHVAQKMSLGIAEICIWKGRTGDFPRGEVYAEVLQHNVRYIKRIDLEDVTTGWNFLKDRTLQFGARNSYWNRMGQGKYREFTFEHHECVAFSQFWGSVAETRGVDAGTRMLFGYYCQPAGASLGQATIDGLLDSLRVRTTGDLVVPGPELGAIE